jgi:uncharacterized repeat protein (TIGR02543 family)
MLFVILAFALTLTLFSAPAALPDEGAEAAEVKDSFTYTHENVTLNYVITSVAGNQGAVENTVQVGNGWSRAFVSGDGGGVIKIPSTVVRDSVEYRVASIAEVAFQACPNLTSLVIEGNLDSIGQWAFKECPYLASVYIMGDVGTIGYQSFHNCDSLASVTIDGSVDSMDQWAFEGSGVLTSFNVGGDLLTIGYQAFYGMGSLTSVTIGGEVRKIAQWAFSNCSELSSITLSDSLDDIGWQAFQGCTSLTTVTLKLDGSGIAEGGVIEKYFSNGSTGGVLPGQTERTIDVLILETPGGNAPLDAIASIPGMTIVHYDGESIEVYEGHGEGGWSVETSQVAIVFDANGGSTSESVVFLSPGSTIGSLPLAARDAHAFLGWFTSEGTQVTAQSVFTENTALHAEWVLEDSFYTVSFAGGGGTGVMSPDVFLIGEPKAIKLNQYVRTGYTFAGWDVVPGGQNPVYYDGQVVVDLGSAGDMITLYAVWTVNVYTVTWNVDGTASISRVAYGEMPAYGGTPEKAQDHMYTYTFAGWSPERSAVSGPATYVAVFDAEPRSYNVTLVTNGGTVGSGAVTTYTYGTGVQLPSDVIRDGYAFAGWYASASLTGSEVNSILESEFGDRTYYAAWVADSGGDTPPASTGDNDLGRYVGLVLRALLVIFAVFGVGYLIYRFR